MPARSGPGGRTAGTARRRRLLPDPVPSHPVPPPGGRSPAGPPAARGDAARREVRGGAAARPPPGRGPPCLAASHAFGDPSGGGGPAGGGGDAAVMALEEKREKRPPVTPMMIEEEAALRNGSRGLPPGPWAEAAGPRPRTTERHIAVHKRLVLGFAVSILALLARGRCRDLQSQGQCPPPRAQQRPHEGPDSSAFQGLAPGRRQTPTQGWCADQTALRRGGPRPGR